MLEKLNELISIYNNWIYEELEINEYFKSGGQ